MLAQAAIIDGLLHSGTLDTPVERIDTHGAVVLLSGARAMQAGYDLGKIAWSRIDAGGEPHQTLKVARVEIARTLEGLPSTISIWRVEYFTGPKWPA